jgi:hypothetical protein
LTRRRSAALLNLLGPEQRAAGDNDQNIVGPPRDDRFHGQFRMGACRGASAGRYAKKTGFC